MKTLLKVKTYTIAAVLLTLLSCNGLSQEGKTPTITKTFEMNQPGKLNARSSGGGIIVRTHDQNEVVVQVFIRKNGRLLSSSDPLVDEVLEYFDMEIEKNGSVINAVVERRGNFKFTRNEGISLIIIVPDEMSCHVSSSGGGLRISGVTGTHNFSSSGGGIHLENVTGTTQASSSGGGVKAINQKGDIKLSSSGGGVTIDDAIGRIIAHSSGGGVHLNNIRGAVDASSSGGGVTVKGVSGSVKATSSGGSVNVNIADLSEKLYLESSGGGVNATIQNGSNLGLDLDLKAGKVNIDLQNFSGNTQKGHVKGTMNNGGIPVYMRASGGNVNVRFVD